ncbi:hypothetical protein COCVIDRAFT_32561 [Bipolaris victoriae FI3]|uniref:Uncharacterized protein n=1 Tax=Bipolaris victoriae (strain FI3) TaxID=930091 RepID=W7F4R8_BIPV3|nr:hypothetical protein COCVIDRAFT_32561 [Bipolaris victoriae FI3]
MPNQPTQIHEDNPSSPPPSSSTTITTTTSTSSINPTTSILTPHQNTLLSTYLQHHRAETQCMNLLVSLDISIRRERDEPGIRHLERYMARVRLRLVGVREERRRAEARIDAEVERLKGVRGVEARMQVEEVRRVVGRERGRGVECLR